VIVRRHFLSEEARQSVDAIKERLSTRKKLTFGVLLFYAFMPLPSNYLFIAYGLTTLELKLITVSFFIGRWASYSFWAYTGSRIARKASFDSGSAFSYLSAYFIATQIFLLCLVYLFARIDWRLFLAERKLRLLSRKGGLP
jgi:hypothetical protein